MKTHTADCDVLVIGSGAAGLATAVRAAWHGLRVIVIEKEAVFGGATAWSGGWLWIPRNPLAREAGIDEDPQAPKTYLRNELGEHYDESRVDAFLDAGPAMVEFFHRNTALQFLPGNTVPDFHGNIDGAGTGGRSVTAAPFNGRELGPMIDQLRPPLKEMSFWGMGIASGQDLGHFLKFLRSVPSTWHVCKRMTRHLLDLALHRRGMLLVNGNALVARLARSALDLSVEIRLSTTVETLVKDKDGRVTGAMVATTEGLQEIHARAGVVLACGGFPHDKKRIKQLFPHAPTGAEHYSAAPKTNTGDGIRLGETAGGQLEDGYPAAGAWAPVSLVQRESGETAHFPHLMERAKPGLIAVTRSGKRFVNEADSYHDFVQALLDACPTGEPVEAWLVCDHRFLRRYGLGNIKPFPLPFGSHLRDGYLKRGNSPAALALACGLDTAGLQTTLDNYNRHARNGQDPEFGRGDTAYNRIQGDADQQPNPCVAPIDQAALYAVQVRPGSLGTFAGLKTDAVARVLNGDGDPVSGLYAVGTDMASIMAGHYPAGGINLGPAMTFGFIAANHIASHQKPSS
ncbi:FAD-dependent oxidoreductase [Marinobacterium sedimentorum]|uniref:FAD-dependent oxidoreductase n=1 Tax=Marinobacterium sedimentorum TaxID=2927804 RepID=UPI0020C68DD0|nr:FAD-dependent oxidoreductase [Marinobacterium sedimentorum]MCP8687590.1 FAD-dependent oxidoreductase [Marinobacterium sedimentorum]